MISDCIKEDLEKNIRQYIKKASEKLDAEVNIESIFVAGECLDDKKDSKKIDLFIELFLDLEESNDIYKKYSKNLTYSNNIFTENNIIDGEIELLNDLKNTIYLDNSNYGKLEYNGYEINISLQSYNIDESLEEALENNNITHKELSEQIIIAKKNRIKQQISDFKSSKIPNAYNSKEVREAFSSLAYQQRDKPESQMLKTQNLLSGNTNTYLGATSYMFEHVGDIIHRVSQNIYIDFNNMNLAINDILPKIDRSLNILDGDFTPEREFNESLISTYNYHSKNNEIFNSKYPTIDDFKSDILENMKKYSELHNELPVYNKVQYHSKQASVSLGLLDFKTTSHHLNELMKMINDESYGYYCATFDKDYELNLKPETIVLYHGTNENFDEFDKSKVGYRLTSLGLGHYLTDDYEMAKEYGDNILAFNVETKNMLDWDNLTIRDRYYIQKALEEVVPDHRMAGFGQIIEVHLPESKEGLNEFRKLQEMTKDYYHDSAKAQIVDSEEEAIVVQYRKAKSLELANNQQLMTLMNEYRPELAKELGYSSSKFGRQVAIYDPSLAKKYTFDGFENKIERKNKFKI